MADPLNDHDVIATYALVQRPTGWFVLLGDAEAGPYPNQAAARRAAIQHAAELLEVTDG